MDRITVGLKVDGGGSLRGAQAVKSKDYEKVWFVAADIQGPGMTGKGEIAVWATNDLTGASGLTLAVDGLAAEFSDWGKKPGLTVKDDGAKQAKDCVKKALK